MRSGQDLAPTIHHSMAHSKDPGQRKSRKLPGLWSCKTGNIQKNAAHEEAQTHALHSRPQTLAVRLVVIDLSALLPETAPQGDVDVSMKDLFALWEM